MQRPRLKHVFLFCWKLEVLQAEGFAHLAALQNRFRFNPDIKGLFPRVQRGPFRDMREDIQMFKTDALALLPGCMKSLHPPARGAETSGWHAVLSNRQASPTLGVLCPKLPRRQYAGHQPRKRLAGPWQRHGKGEQSKRACRSDAEHPVTSECMIDIKASGKPRGKRVPADLMWP